MIGVIPPLTSLLFSLAVLAGIASSSRAGGAADWVKTPSTHFIVLHTAADAALAQTVSERAEVYYAGIAADLGYTRYQKFWLWENRVKILIYPTAAEFTAACKAPAWAVGRANSENHEIASFRQSSGAFLNSLLPHELSHLILGDFIGRGHLPLWLNEGFAQWEQSKHLAPPSPRPPRWFRLKDLTVMEIRNEPDSGRVALFYAQSASLVGFLITSQGGEAFGTFCRGLRDGKPLEAALASAYPGTLSSLDRLEQKWLTSPPAAAGAQGFTSSSAK